MRLDPPYCSDLSNSVLQRHQCSSAWSGGGTVWGRSQNLQEVESCGRKAVPFGGLRDFMALFHFQCASLCFLYLLEDVGTQLLLWRPRHACHHDGLLPSGTLYAHACTHVKSEKICRSRFSPATIWTLGNWTRVFRLGRVWPAPLSNS